MYKVTVTGAGTNQNNRIVRYFDNREAANAYADNRRNGIADVTVKRLKVHSDEATA